MGDAFESTELAIFTLFGCFADLHYVSALNHGGGLKSAATVCVSCVCVTASTQVRQLGPVEDCQSGHGFLPLRVAMAVRTVLLVERTWAWNGFDHTGRRIEKNTWAVLVK